MQFSHPSELVALVDDMIFDPLTAKVFREQFDYWGIDPAEIPETLAGCSFFGKDRELTVGTREADVPHAWFRSVIVPDSEQAFDDFLCRLRMLMEQLGPFFLLPEPEVNQEKLLAWSESVDPHLEWLFGKDHLPHKFSRTFALRTHALTAAIEETAGEEARRLLTPRFLESDLIRPSYPVAETEIKSKRSNILISAFMLRSLKEVNEEHKTISLLVVKLMQKWGWPVGLQTLARRRNSPESSSELSAGRAAWQPLEIEVDKLLSQTRNTYPIVFDC
jgi:hypothetical protein